MASSLPTEQDAEQIPPVQLPNLRYVSTLVEHFETKRTGSCKRSMSLPTANMPRSATTFNRHTTPDSMSLERSSLLGLPTPQRILTGVKPSHPQVYPVQARSLYVEPENGESGNGSWTSKGRLPPIPRDLSELEPSSVADSESTQTASPSTPYSMESTVQAPASVERRGSVRDRAAASPLSVHHSHHLPMARGMDASDIPRDQEQHVMDSVTSSKPSVRQPHAAFPIDNLDPFISADGICVVTSDRQLLPHVKATTICSAPLSNLGGSPATAKLPDTILARVLHQIAAWNSEIESAQNRTTAHNANTLPQRRHVAGLIAGFNDQAFLESPESGPSCTYRSTQQGRAIMDSPSQPPIQATPTRDLVKSLFAAPTAFLDPSTEVSAIAAATAATPAVLLVSPEQCPSPRQAGGLLTPVGSPAWEVSESEERNPRRHCDVWTSDGTGGARGASCIQDWSSDDELGVNQRYLPDASLMESWGSNQFPSPERASAISAQPHIRLRPRLTASAPDLADLPTMVIGSPFAARVPQPTFCDTARLEAAVLQLSLREPSGYTSDIGDHSTYTKYNNSTNCMQKWHADVCISSDRQHASMLKQSYGTDNAAINNYQRK